MLREKVAVEGCAVQVVATGRGFVVLEWGHGVKYDGVRKWAYNTIGLDKGLWTVVADVTTDKVESLGQGELPTVLPAAASECTHLGDSDITRATAAPPNVLVLKASALLHAPKPLEQWQKFNAVYEVLSDGILGEGEYGTVYAGRGRDGSSEELAFKRLPTRRACDRWAAVEEVAAFAAVLPHRHILLLYDVGVDDSSLYLVFPRFHSSLQAWAAARSGRLAIEEVHHVAYSVCSGLRRMHSCRLIHADLKPSNVLVHGTGLLDAAPGDIARRLLELPSSLHVVIGDLGRAKPSDPAHRAIPASVDVVADGVQEAALIYRAPEVLLGDARLHHPPNVLIAMFAITALRLDAADPCEGTKTNLGNTKHLCSYVCRDLSGCLV